MWCSWFNKSQLMPFCTPRFPVTVLDMENSATCLNGMDLLKSLSIEAVESRLAELKGEQDALRTVLRSIKARDRAKRRRRQSEVTA
jgi:hypothetical protein